ncbi:hypothetical protein GCM10023196_094200 [Actinoallomurus vinaceus]|uniref:Uncharacterized protein n=1 Tax=Actinoallomurus vinaceus TaxID=1080074 RepID=A0ABP8UV65_9ACTN
MDTKNRRRKPVLIAAVVAGGVVATVTAVAPSTSASSATAAAAAKVTAGGYGRPVSGGPKVSLVVTADSPANTGRNVKMCAAAHGKYQGTVVRTFPVTGGASAAKGRPGGVLIVMRSTVCGTAWVDLKKYGTYNRQAHRTIVWIATYATAATDHSKLGEDYRQATTREVLSTRAVPASAHGSLEVEARWTGKGFAFYNAVPVLY